MNRPHRLLPWRLVQLWTVLLLSSTSGFAQQLLELGAADVKRIEQLQQGGYQVTGDHVVMWFPTILSRSDAENLRDDLDRVIGEARQMIRSQSWQRLGAGQKITYYFVDGPIVSHGTGLGKVFIPAALLHQRARAPLLTSGVVELLTPVRELPDAPPNGDVFAPDFVLSVWLGLRHYITLTASERTGFGETGEYDLRRLGDVDALCVTRVRETDPAMILPYIGAAGRPAWGAQQSKYQPAFQTCSTSFTKFLIELSGFERVLALIPRLPDGAKAVHAEMERITGRAIATLQTEWQQEIDAAP